MPIWAHPAPPARAARCLLLGAVGVVAALRGLGFVGMIAGVHTPLALVLPYIGLAAVSVLGYLAISRGVIIEPPAVITDFINAIDERLNSAPERDGRANAMITGNALALFRTALRLGGAGRCLRAHWCSPP